MTTRTEVFEMVKVPNFVSWGFSVYPGELALPEYWRQTNRSEQDRRLATISVGVTADKLSAYALIACAKGFKPWRYDFLKSVNDKLLVDSYPILPEEVAGLEHIAEQRLIDAIERGAQDWCLEHTTMSV